jgi:hypothetical protein
VRQFAQGSLRVKEKKREGDIQKKIYTEKKGEKRTSERARPQRKTFLILQLGGKAADIAHYLIYFVFIWI